MKKAIFLSPCFSVIIQSYLSVARCWRLLAPYLLLTLSLPDLTSTNQVTAFFTSDILKDVLGLCCLDCAVNTFTSTLLSSQTEFCSMCAYSLGEKSCILLDAEEDWKGWVFFPGRGILVTIHTQQDFLISFWVVLNSEWDSSDCSSGTDFFWPLNDHKCFLRCSATHYNLGPGWGSDMREKRSCPREVQELGWGKGWIAEERREK